MWALSRNKYRFFHFSILDKRGKRWSPDASKHLNNTPQYLLVVLKQILVHNIFTIKEFKYYYSDFGRNLLFDLWWDFWLRLYNFYMHCNSDSFNHPRIKRTVYAVVSVHKISIKFKRNQFAVLKPKLTRVTCPLISYVLRF